MQPRRIIVSPHLDDAVYSLGRTIAGTTDGTLILTVLAGLPVGGGVTAYDAACGFDTSIGAMRTRRAENHRAATVLGVHHRELPFLDSQYAPPPDVKAVTARLEREFALIDEAWLPLGLFHPDHVAVADAGRVAAEVARVPTVVVYEELPYRVWHPEETAVRLALLDVEPAGWPQAPRQVKHAAVECYQSQLDDDIRASLYVPERMWRLPVPPRDELIDEEVDVAVL